MTVPSSLIPAWTASLSFSSSFWVPFLGFSLLLGLLLSSLGVGVVVGHDYGRPTSPESGAFALVIFLAGLFELNPRTGVGPACFPGAQPLTRGWCSLS